MRLVFFDLETGGLDPVAHPIIQIAAIAVDERLRELAEFEAKVLFKTENADPHARPQLPKPENFKLEALAKYFDVPLTNAHDALADCRANLAVYRALRQAEQKIPPEMIDFAAPEMMAAYDGQDPLT